jgi:hypothetical protein
MQSQHVSGSHDFDFFMGSWRVQHRRLNERLVGDHEWQEFEGATTAQAILGGTGNIDDNEIDLPGEAYRAVTLRTFDPDLRQWSIWWFDGRHPTRFDPPVVGSFENGVGTFYGEDILNGKPIRVRFLWTETTSATPRWEQAFSADAGRSWETNWTMSFTRSR